MTYVKPIFFAAFLILCYKEVKIAYSETNMPVKKPTSSIGDPDFVPSQGRNYKFVFWFLVILAIILAVAATAFMLQNRHLRNSQQSLQKQLSEVRLGSGQNSADTVAQNNDKLVAAVGQLMVLPTDEQPTIATVTDLEKLKDQPFFANAQIGDKVLIYTSAKKAILYRSSENKIIELAPLNLGSSPSAASSLAPKATLADILTVEIRNGSGKSGVAQSFKIKLSSSSEFSVIKIANAASIYDKSVLYVTDAKKMSAAVTRLQQLSSAEIVSALPSGEPQSAADAVLILGKQ